MIWHPKKGQSVKVHYRKSLQSAMPCQGIRGEVVEVAPGPGPINVLIKVELWAGTGQYFYEVIPRGNLVARKDNPNQMR